MAEPDSSPAAAEVIEPPTSIGGILRKLGPGLIIAGSIVGSGELIATTVVGAEAGFVLLWLIIVGCVIKVFVQIEFGRYAIVCGRTTMDGLNEVPGPRLRVNWVCWFWLIFTAVAFAQIGGIIGGVGQAAAIQWPLTESGEALNQFTHEQIQATIQKRPGPSGEEPSSNDAVLWASIISAVSIIVLVLGRYRLIQNVSTALVVSFSAITIANLIYLQALPEWGVTWAELVEGMSFRIPDGDGLATALAAFGIIGVGATELIQYPYWCIEKGYGRWTGPREDSADWARRANGWIRVMRWDAWCSMVVYTVTTVIFYLLGAAILQRAGLQPEGKRLVATLSEMYVPVFGAWAKGLFMFGALAVLYSTFFVATASHARVCADALRVFGVSRPGEAAYRFWVRIFCGGLPLLFLACFAFFEAPKQLVLAGGFMGALMLPILGIAGLYFRYRRSDARLLPGRIWDLFLWLSVLGMCVAGAHALYDKVFAKL